MKHVGTLNVLCVGGEVLAAELRGIVPGRPKIHSIAVSWDEALVTLSQSCFDVVVMDSWNTAFDKEREQIMAMLPTKTAALLLPRQAGDRSPAQVTRPQEKWQAA